MTQADRVRSTPRKAAPKTKSQANPPGGWTDEMRARLYRDIEGSLLDLSQQAAVVEAGVDGDHDWLEHAAYMLCGMVRDFREKYYGRMPADQGRGAGADR
jgi:hypothetical protein